MGDNNGECLSYLRIEFCPKPEWEATLISPSPVNMQARRITSVDEDFLWAMLYEAAQMEKAGEPFESIQYNSSLARYVKGWGREHDHGFLVEDSFGGKPIAAAWVRMLTEKENEGYGFVADGVPELALATRKSHRRQGAGSLALQSLLRHLHGTYPAISLSVREDNLPAISLYEKAGFTRIVGSEIKIQRSGKSFKMILEL